MLGFSPLPFPPRQFRSSPASSAFSTRPLPSGAGEARFDPPCLLALFLLLPRPLLSLLPPLGLSFNRNSQPEEGEIEFPQSSVLLAVPDLSCKARNEAGFLDSFLHVVHRRLEVAHPKFLDVDVAADFAADESEEFFNRRRLGDLKIDQPWTRVRTGNRSS